MLRPFESAEEMVQTLQAARVVSSDDSTVLSHLAEQFEQMRMDPNGLGYWITKGFWSYAVEVYGGVDQESGDSASGNGNTLPQSTAFYKQLITTYGSGVVQTIVADEFRETVMSYLNTVVERLS